MKCVLCGKTITSDMVICSACMPDSGEETKELEDVAAVLAITADTDTNIKRSMEAILNIAGRLKRKGKKDGL